MAKVFEKVLRADVLGGAELLKGKLSTDPRGRFKLGKLRGGGSVEFISAAAHLHLVNYSLGKAQN